MNKSLKVLSLSCMVAFAAMGQFNSAHAVRQESALTEGVKAAFAGFGIAGATFLAKAAYLKYLVYTTPELTLNPNPLKRKEGHSKSMRIYQWATIDTADFGAFETPGSLLRAHQEKSIAENFIKDCQSPQIALYYQCGESESQFRCAITPDIILKAIQYEIQRLTKYMDRLQWFTNIANVYESFIDSIGDAESYELQKLTEAQEERVINSMEKHISRFNKKPKNWAYWFANTVFCAFQEDVEQKYWDLFVARSRLKALHDIVSDYTKYAPQPARLNLQISRNR